MKNVKIIKITGSTRSPSHLRYHSLMSSSSSLPSTSQTTSSSTLPTPSHLPLSLGSTKRVSIVVCEWTSWEAALWVRSTVKIFIFTSAHLTHWSLTHCRLVAEPLSFLLLSKGGHADHCCKVNIFWESLSWLVHTWLIFMLSDLLSRWGEWFCSGWD